MKTNKYRPNKGLPSNYMIKPGYVYIITNKSFPGWVKVGRTADVEGRVKHYNVCDPHRSYKVSWYSWVKDTYKIEKLFADSREEEYEWYKMTVAQAKKQLIKLINDN